jgi:hypothetical protein
LADDEEFLVGSEGGFVTAVEEAAIVGRTMNPWQNFGPNTGSTLTPLASPTMKPAMRAQAVSTGQSQSAACGV